MLGPKCCEANASNAALLHTFLRVISLSSIVDSRSCWIDSDFRVNKSTVRTSAFSRLGDRDSHLSHSAHTNHSKDDYSHNIVRPLTQVSMATFQLVKVFLTTLYQYHTVMGGSSIVAIGYEVADALERYQRQHDIEGVSSFKQLLQYVESEISIPTSLVRLEDSSGLTRMFLCCYVDTRIRVYDCEELMAVIVPPQFMRVKEVLGIDGDLKRVFAPQGMIFSYDVNGKTRVEEECLIAVI